jgi:hypothetical protein
MSSNWVNLKLHNEKQRYTFPGRALKVCVVWCLLVGWWVGVENEFGGQIWLELSLDQGNNN